MRFLYKGKWVEYDGLCDDAKCPDNLNGHCHKEYWKEYECKERKKNKDAMATVVTHIRPEATPEVMENFRKNFRAVIAVWFGRCTALANELGVSRQAITNLMSDTRLIDNRYFYAILYIIVKNLYGRELLIFDLTNECLTGIINDDELMLSRIYRIIDEHGSRLHSDPLYTNKDIMKYIVDGKAEVVVSGNCVVCGKQLSRGRLFVCEECELKQLKKEEVS